MRVEMRAEMVASVWKVLVAEGSEVEQGAELAILESMKMEIPIEAESAGRVVEFCVREGDAIVEGQLLVVLEVL